MKNIKWFLLAALVGLSSLARAQDYAAFEACRASFICPTLDCGGGVGSCETREEWVPRDGGNAYYIALGQTCWNNGIQMTAFWNTCEVSFSRPPGYLPPATIPPIHSQRQCGSIIDVDSQAVGERIPVTGTDFDLVYTSKYAQNREADYKLGVPLSGNPKNSSIADFDITVNILGVQVVNTTITNADDLVYSYQWNGLNSSSAPVLGPVVATVVAVPDGTSLQLPFKYTIGTLKAKLLGFGGWMPSNYHFFAKDAKLLFKGDGTVRKVAPIELSSGNLLVPEADGSRVYEFTASGKHLYTRTGLIGTTVATFNHNTAGLLTSISLPFSRTVTFTRDTSGKLTSITSPEGDVTSIVINSSGLLASVTNPESEQFQVTYISGTDLMATFTKPGLQASTFTYDSEGRLATDDHSGGRELDFARSQYYYDQVDVTETTGLGRVTTSRVSNLLSNPSASYVRTIMKPSGGSETYSEEAGTFGFVGSGLNRTFSATPDVRFGMSAPFHAQITVGSRYVTYSQSVSLNTSSDIFSVDTLTMTSTLDGQNTVSEFDGSTKTATTTSPLGRTSTVEVDNYERVISRQWATDTAVDFTYTNDKLTAITQGARTTTFAYNSTTGLLSSTTNDLSQTTSYTYDAAKRLTYVTYPDSRQIQFTYDDNGNLIGVTPPGRSIHNLVMNGHELLGSYEPPALTPLVVNTGYTYNDDRQLTQITRPDAQTIDFTYGSTTGVLSSITTPDGTYSYNFDASSGQVTYASTPGSDNMNSLGYWNQLVTSDFVYAGSNSIGSYSPYYNSLLQMTSETVSPVNDTPITVNFAYDYDEGLIEAGDLDITRNTTTARIDSTALGSVTDTWAYNSFGEITGYELKYGTTTLFQYTITRDDLGRVDTLADTVQGTTNNFDYNYDSSGRLSTVTKNSNPYSSYTYDSNSNRTSGTSGSVSFAATYNAQDWMTDYNVYDYTYTNSGELASKTNTLTSQTTTYVYDVLGNLKSVTLPSTDVVSYGVDALNRRVSRSFNGTVTSYYFYRGNQVVAELDNSKAFKAFYVYGTKTHVPDYMIVGSEKYRIVTDHLGSVRMVVKVSDGTVAQKIEYNDLGKVISDTSPGFQPFGYAGGLYDSATGLVRFGARDYDPEVGRWTIKDPILFVGGDTNLYGYVLADPINFIDPDGTNPVLLAGIILGGILAPIPTDTPITTLDEAGRVAGGAALGGMCSMAVLGAEISAFGMRFAPFGNRTGNPTGQLPHYHRRSFDPMTGQTAPGQGIGRHRPWDSRSTDTSFWNRF